MSWYVYLHRPLSHRISGPYRTKREAEVERKKWQAHIDGLKHKPRGTLHVITQAKYDAMAYSCAVSYRTTPKEDAAIVARGKRDQKRFERMLDAIKRVVAENPKASDEKLVAIACAKIVKLPQYDGASTVAHNMAIHVANAKYDANAKREGVR